MTDYAAAIVAVHRVNAYVELKAWDWEELAGRWLQCIPRTSQCTKHRRVRRKTALSSRPRPGEDRGRRGHSPVSWRSLPPSVSSSSSSWSESPRWGAGGGVSTISFIISSTKTGASSPTSPTAAASGPVHSAGTQYTGRSTLRAGGGGSSADYCLQCVCACVCVCVCLCASSLWLIPFHRSCHGGSKVAASNYMRITGWGGCIKPISPTRGLHIATIILSMHLGQLDRWQSGL